MRASAALIRSVDRVRFEVLPGKPLRLGRKASCDVQIEDLAVSGFHCVVSISDAGALIVTDSSTNGTFVNGERVANGMTMDLRAGDQLQLSKPKSEEKEQRPVTLFCVELDNGEDIGRERSVVSPAERRSADASPHPKQDGNDDMGERYIKEKEECCRLSAALVASQRTADEHKRRAETLQASLSLANQNLSEERQKVAALDAKLGAAAGDRGRLDAEKKIADRARQDAERLEKENTDLEVELSSKTRRLEEAESALAKAQEAATTAEEQGKQLRHEHVELQTRASTLVKQADTFRSQKDKLEQENRQLQADLAERNLEVEKTQDTIAKLEGTIRGMGAEKEPLVQDAEQARRERDRLHAALADMEVKWRTACHERDTEKRETAFHRDRAELADRQGARLQELTRLLTGVAADASRAARIADGEETAPAGDTIPADRAATVAVEDGHRSQGASGVGKGDEEKENSQSLANSQDVEKEQHSSPYGRDSAGGSDRKRQREVLEGPPEKRFAEAKPPAGPLETLPPAFCGGFGDHLPKLT
jgi:pSer/pThr/pTyr-binding forkhead associated (FHA) protein